MIKKIEKSINVELPPIKIFLEDIKAIEEILKNNCKSFKIETKDYQLDSCDELQQISETKLNYIKIISSQPFISLTLGENIAYIYSQDDITSMGIVTKIQAILEKRTNWLKYFANPLILLIISTFNISLVIISHELEGVKELDSIKIIIALINLFMIGISFMVKYSIIYIKIKDEINFFIKNKNQIILLFLGGIITFIGQTLVQLIIQLWIKHLP